MAKPSHYAVLGVGRDETTEGIRAAWRRLARQTHPDSTGSEQADDFLQIAEAYRVLSDPEERERYDAARARAAERASAQWSESSAAEPLIAEPMCGGPERRGICPTEPMAEPLRSRRPSLERSGQLGRTQAQVDVVLTPEQAAIGVVVGVQVRAAHVCPRCGGWRSLASRCSECGGRGARVVLETVRVHIPAGVQGGTVIRVPFGDGALGPASLRVRIARAGV